MIQENSAILNWICYIIRRVHYIKLNTHQENSFLKYIEEQFSAGGIENRIPASNDQLNLWLNLCRFFCGVIWMKLMNFLMMFHLIFLSFFFIIIVTYINFDIFAVIQCTNISIPSYAKTYKQSYEMLKFIEWHRE